MFATRLSVAAFSAALVMATGAIVCAQAQEFKPSAPGNAISHGIAMHGDMKYPPGAKNFDYVNVNAPRGGEIRIGVIGTFDSFNPYIIKGNPAAGVITTWDGGPAHAGGRIVAAGDPRVHATTLSILQAQA